MSEPIDWIYQAGTGCAYCKDGLCQRMNQLMEEGHSQRKASKIMEEEAGKKWRAKSILEMFRRWMSTKVDTPENPHESKAEVGTIGDIVTQIDTKKAEGKSLREAAKEVAKETGKNPETVRKTYNREVKKMASSSMKEAARKALELAREKGISVKKASEIISEETGFKPHSIATCVSSIKIPTVENNVIYEATEAMHIVVMAISQLERIRKDDPKRQEAFSRIINWIKEQEQKQ